METEVFRIVEFNATQTYSFALKTRSEGKWPNVKHYSTHPLQYLGKYTHSERWGYGDNGGGAENFDDHGIKTRIVYDYAGNTCFRSM